MRDGKYPAMPFNQQMTFPTEMTMKPGKNIVVPTKYDLFDVEVDVKLAGGRLQFRLLIDRTSVELFHAGGKTTASFCYLPEARDWPLEFYLYDGSAKIVSLRVHELRSMWK
ncbi:MAG: GH32 C-terminal domain-containing protein [Planctomycetota bacterium]